MLRDLRFSVYDVDGENPNTTGAGTAQSTVNQSEAVRVFKRTSDTSGFMGYQVGSSADALTPYEETDSYLFTSKKFDANGNLTQYGKNQLETSNLGAMLLYFQNTSSVTFQFEADTQAPLTTNTTYGNPVFSAIDGDVSLIGNNSTNFDSNGYATPVTGFGSYTTAKKNSVPEPLTVIGTLIGGAAAVRMKKKLQAAKQN